MTPLPLSARLDGMRAPSAILDEWGEIVFVNRAWSEIGIERGLGGLGSVGSHYAALCRRASEPAQTAACTIANAIEDVARGWRDECHVEYASADGRHWFSAHVWCLAGPGPRRVVVIHEDVTLQRPATLAAPPCPTPTAISRRSPVIAMEWLLAPIDDAEPERDARH